jgi:hypothetical protein
LGFGRFDLGGKRAVVDELAGDAIDLIFAAASSVTGEILVIDDGFWASGVKQ